MSDIYEVIVQEQVNELVLTDPVLEVVITEDNTEVVVDNDSLEITIQDEFIEVLTIAEQGPAGAPSGITASTTEPTNPNVGDIWIDTN